MSLDDEMHFCNNCGCDYDHGCVCGHCGDAEGSEHATVPASPPPGVERLNIVKGAVAGDWVPSTEAVRESFATDDQAEYNDPVNYGSWQNELRKAFDRWLAQHDAEVRLATLREEHELAVVDLRKHFESNDLFKFEGARHRARYLKNRLKELEGNDNEHER